MFVVCCYCLRDADVDHRYRFALPHPSDVLGLPIGQHISVSAEINGKEIMRSYTPTSSDDDLGHFDLLIKVVLKKIFRRTISYRPQSYEKGNISRYISLLKIGDNIRVKGPKGQFNYSSTLSREIGMIAGGTGITPMLQIIRAALKNPQDSTRLSLIYANVNHEDILLKKELDELADKHPSRFKVFYVLNNPPTGWTGGVGFVSKEQIATHLPTSHDNIKILLCGMYTYGQSSTPYKHLNRPSPNDDSHEVRLSCQFLFSRLILCTRNHLDELKYPAPRTVSKLVDQVGASSVIRLSGMPHFNLRSSCFELDDRCIGDV